MPADLYDLLIERASSSAPVRRLLLGLNWSVAEVEACGLCFSPTEASRTLAWPGTVAGRAAAEVVPWIRSPEPAEAAAGVAVINAALNHIENGCLGRARPLSGSGGPPHLRVFAHFKADVRGANVVVVGRYPGLDALWDPRDYVCLERRSLPGTLPESAAEQVLPRADWVFLTASSLANHTLPRLLRLSRGARVVLMGPSVPWMAEWSDFGVHFLAGVAVRDAGALLQIAAEGGGTRIFDHAVEYRLIQLA